MKKLIAIALAAASLVYGIAAKEIYGKPWVNSNIADNLPDTPARIQDDFALAVNYDWNKTAKLPENSFVRSNFYELAEKNKKEILSILQGKKASSHEEQLVQTLYRQALDWKKRNKDGINPALPGLKKIQETKNLKELKALFAERNSDYGTVFELGYNMPDFKNSSSYITYIGEALYMLPDADWYTEELSDDAKMQLSLKEEIFTSLLVKFGYSKEQAAEMIDRVFTLENKYGPYSIGTTARSQLDFKSKIYNIFSKEEVIKNYPNLPVAEILKNNGADFVTKIQLINPQALKVINDLFTEENFEALKDWSIILYVSSASVNLDRECYNINMDYVNKLNGSSIKQTDQEIAYDAANALDMALGKVWVEKYFKPEIKEDVSNITKELISTLDKHIRSLDWMTPETKEKALEKLHAIKLQIGYPDKWKDYSNLNLPEDYKKGSLYETMKIISEYEFNSTMEKVQKPVESEWSYPPQLVNAFYYPLDNSINMLAGILGGDFYQLDWPVEKKYAAIGMVIGHELTHGFDASGSQFDLQGNMKNWWAEKDLAAFTEKNQKIADYYSTFEVVPGVMNNGLLCIGEIVADLGGVTLTLDMAKNHPGFDYDAYFRALATAWKEIGPYEYIKQVCMFDEHPCNYIRVNATVQHFQEFYDTYNVKEGDGMYLAPEDRLLIW